MLRLVSTNFSFVSGRHTLLCVVHRVDVVFSTEHFGEFYFYFWVVVANVSDALITISRSARSLVWAFSVEFAHHVFRVLSFTDANEEALLSVELQTKEDRQLCLRQCTEVIQNEGTRFICIQTLLLIALSGGEYDARARVRRTLPPPKKKSACAERLHARFSLFQYSELRCLSFCRLVFIDFRLCSLLPSYRR